MTLLIKSANKFPSFYTRYYIKINQKRQAVKDTRSKTEELNKPMDKNDDSKKEAPRSNSQESEKTSSKSTGESSSAESEELSFPDFSKF